MVGFLEEVVALVGVSEVGVSMSMASSLFVVLGVETE